MNRLITIIGNLTRDPETRVTQNGRNVCNFIVAQNSVSRQRKPDGTYSNEKSTLYFRVTTWGSDAENCGKYLKKGRKVCVHGELDINVARDANGKVIYKKGPDGNLTDEPFINLEIAAEGRTSFLSNASPDEGAEASTATQAPAQSASPAPSAPPAAVIDPSGATVVNADDELPF